MNKQQSVTWWDAKEPPTCKCGEKVTRTMSKNRYSDMITCNINCDKCEINHVVAGYGNIDPIIMNVVNKWHDEHIENHRKRMGIFYVRFDLIENPGFRKILGQMKFVPYKVESHLYKKEMEYIGTSPFFDEIKRGEQTPKYNIVIKNKDDDFDFKVEKRIYSKISTEEFLKSLNIEKKDEYKKIN